MHQQTTERLDYQNVPYTKCVEFLMGTVFEMRLSGGETVGNIKLRLQRLEGIPRQHMHLLYRGKANLMSVKQETVTVEQETVTVAVVDCLGLVDEDDQGEAGGVWRWFAIQWHI